MHGFQKAAIASIVSAVSFQSFAEILPLDEANLRGITGQAGLTIDLETKRRIEEFAWKDGDAGYVLQSGMVFGGNNSAEEVAFSGGHGLLDNLRLNIDVAGTGATQSSNTFNYGFSSWSEFFKVHTDAGNTDASMLLAAGETTGTPIDPNTGLLIDTKRSYDDGDLVIHITPTDAWQKGGGFSAFDSGNGYSQTSTGYGLDNVSYDEIVEIFTRAMDYNLAWDAVGLATSDYDPGTGGMLDPSPDTTVLLSDINVNGYFGPINVHIENNGNGFGADGSGIAGNPNSGNANSKIHLEAFFDVTDFDIYIDIAGLQLSDIKIHNRRGDLGTMNMDANGTGYTSSFGMAHGKRDIYAVSDTVFNMSDVTNNPYVDGMGHDTQFKGDIDIGGISFGDSNQSVGQVFLTDYQFTQNWVISAH